MSLFIIRILIHKTNESYAALAWRLPAFILAQPEIAIFEMPDIPADQMPVLIEEHRYGVHLAFVVAHSARADAVRQMLLLSARLHTQAFEGGREKNLDLAGSVEWAPTRMELDLVLQDPVSEGFYGLYRAGAVYALEGHERIEELENPHSVLFQPGGLRKLPAPHASQVRGSKRLRHIWSQRGSLKTPAVLSPAEILSRSDLQSQKRIG